MQCRGSILGYLQNKTLADETEWPYTKKTCDFHCNRTEKLRIVPKSAGWSLSDSNNDGFFDLVVNQIDGYTRFFRSVPSTEARKNRFIVFQ